MNGSCPALRASGFLRTRCPINLVCLCPAPVCAVAAMEVGSGAFGAAAMSTRANSLVFVLSGALELEAADRERVFTLGADLKFHQSWLGRRSH